MPNISFVPSMLSSTTFNYHSGDTGGFRAFAHVDGEAGNAYDVDNINYIWTFDNAPITGAMYASFNVNKGTYNPLGVITGLVAEAPVFKPTIFGVNSPVLKTHGLLPDMTSKQFKCTAQHKKGGNIIIHTITITFTPETTFLVGGTTARAGWRPAYWNRLGVVGEVCEYGRILVNIEDAITEKHEAVFANRTPLNAPIELADILTRDINPAAILPRKGGITRTFSQGTGPAPGYTGMDACLTSQDFGETAGALNGAGLLVTGFVGITSPITTRVMHAVQDSFLRIAHHYALNESSPGGVASNLYPITLMNTIAPAVAATDYTLSDPLLTNVIKALVDATAIAGMPSGYVLSKEKRSPLDGTGYAPSIGVGEPTVVAFRIDDVTSNMSPTNLFALVDGTFININASDVNYSMTFGTHRLRGETMVTKSRPFGMFVYTDPESVIGTKIKPAHFLGIKEALNLMYIARLISGSDETIDCSLANIRWKYGGESKQGQRESLEYDPCIDSFVNPTAAQKAQLLSTYSSPTFIFPNPSTTIPGVELDIINAWDVQQTTALNLKDRGFCAPCDDTPVDPPDCDCIEISNDSDFLVKVYDYKSLVAPALPYCDPSSGTETGPGEPFEGGSGGVSVPTPLPIPPCPSPGPGPLNSLVNGLPIIPPASSIGMTAFPPGAFTPPPTPIPGGGSTVTTGPYTYSIEYDKLPGIGGREYITVHAGTSTQVGTWKCATANHTLYTNSITVLSDSSRIQARRDPYAYDAVILAGGSNGLTGATAQPIINSKVIWAGVASESLRLTVRRDMNVATPITTADGYLNAVPAAPPSREVADTFTFPVTSLEDTLGASVGIPLNMIDFSLASIPRLGFFLSSFKLVEDGLYYQSVDGLGFDTKMTAYTDYWYGAGGAANNDTLYGSANTWGLDYSAKTVVEHNFNYNQHARKYGMLFCA